MPFVVYCFVQLSSFAQSVTGTVKNASGELLPGASVLIKGTSTGVLTNADGRFELKGVAPGDYTLVASFLEYSSQEKEARLSNGKNEAVHFKLAPDAKELGEVAVFGRSETKEVNRLAYNVIAVDAKKLHNSTLDLSNALDRVSGVRVRESGGVGSRMSFSLNGFTGRQVKFFIDGVPMDNFGSSFQLTSSV